MTSKRNGPVRQLSLRSSSPQRPKLKKQLSVDTGSLHSQESFASNSTNLKLAPRLAWMDRDNNVEIVAKKCLEYAKPMKLSMPINLSTNEEKQSYSRHQLAERLRKAWREREKSKKSLDIFLTRNSIPKKVELIDEDKLNNSKKQFENPENSFDTTNVCDFKKKTNVEPNENSYQIDFNDSCYTPSTNKSETRERNLKKISLIISSCSIDNTSSFEEETNLTDDTKKNVSNDIKEPQIEFEPEKNTNPLQNNWIFEKGMLLETQTNVDQENYLDDSIPNSTTESLKNEQVLSAKEKREKFQKNANNAFSKSVLDIKDECYRPPLVRALSVPSTPNKIKFTQTKRRLKTAPIRRKANEIDHQNKTEDSNDNKTKNKSQRKGRCRSANGAEIVTMVSITSPPVSDTEENLEKTNILSKQGRNVHTKHVPTKPLQDMQRIINIRKNIKTVSFQQSALTTVRSYSAGFPIRRGSMAVLSGTGFGTPQTPTAITSEREKRVPVTSPVNDTVGPKRKLIRMQFNEKKSDSPNDMIQPSIDENQTKQNDTSTENLVINEQEDLENSTIKIETPIILNKDEEDVDSEPDSEPKFENPREKQCWKMYKKMCDKGIAVSFDTILKGILTPTEYRLRTKNVTKEDTAEKENF